MNFRKISSAVLTLTLAVLPIPSALASADRLDNGAFRFGQTGSSVTDMGFLAQAFYSNGSAWRKLSYSNYGLNLGFGYGSATGENWSGNPTANLRYVGNDTGSSSTDLLVAGSVSIDSSGVSAGSGTLIIRVRYALDGSTANQVIEVEHRVTLVAGKSYSKITTKVTNVSSSNLEKFHVWVGTRDDYVGGDDDVQKIRGNLSGASFTQLSSATDSSNAIKITNGSEDVYFYSETSGVATVVRDGRGVPALFTQDPSTAPISLGNTSDGDDSYALVYTNGDLAASASTTFTWYYVAGESGSVAEVLESVSQDVQDSQGSSSPIPLSFPSLKTPAFDQFASGPALITPGKDLTLTGSRLSCTTYVQINSQSTNFSYGSASGGRSQLTIAIPVGLKPGPHSMTMDSCDGQVTFENLLLVPKPPVVFEAVSRNALERMLVLARLQGFTAVHYGEYNHAECIVNASVPSLQTAAREMFSSACRIATMFLTGSAGSTSELRKTHKPANVWLRVTLSNK